ncbi:MULTISPECIES: orotate phosphoribosyltransferase-like protein [unclassified Archaeoglobus]|jgi:orotate phosphoribosyltransferase|uniref:orotate phosphoribosyltransferase-like protein n=1 Tax=unclassified Archaeoglobus TaxID=2643606 RepID=UPI0025BF7C9F|nr:MULTISPECIES: orotate phosphoribosyltransferase-like protein [unclassified Archaeoglobus]
MTKIETLVERAKRLKEKGLTTEEIADELNVSRETAMWLLTRVTETPPSDIYVEWRELTKPARLRHIASAVAHMIKSEVKDGVDVIVGIATSGIPLASMVAEELGCDLAIYYPRKFKVEDEKPRGGILSENFARVAGKKCVIIDDIISTGRSIKEAAEVIEANEGKPICAAVIVNKRGSREIDSLPVLSMLKIVRI